MTAAPTRTSPPLRLVRPDFLGEWTHTLEPYGSPYGLGIVSSGHFVKQYHLRGGWRGSTLKAVNDVSFTLEAGKTVALVGQSGSGKSTIAKLLMQLERPTSGQILLDGSPIQRHGSGLREYRNNVQMVFQDSFASLNPFHTVEHHLARPLLLHGKAKSGAEVRAGVRGLLERVHLEPVDDVAQRRPHELGRSASTGSHCPRSRPRTHRAKSSSEGPRTTSS